MSQVPVEFIGRARDLRRRIEKDWQRAAPRIEAMLGPLRPRPGFKPVPRHAYMRDLMRRWKALPRCGRIRFAAKFSQGKMHIGELRAVPARIVDTDWAEDELGLGLMLMLINAAPPADLTEAYVTPIIVGQHALSRRYERGIDRSDKAVFEDLHAIMRHYEKDSRGFNVITPSGGNWVGQHGVEGVFVIRSYIYN